MFNVTYCNINKKIIKEKNSQFVNTNYVENWLSKNKNKFYSFDKTPPLVKNEFAHLIKLYIENSMYKEYLDYLPEIYNIIINKDKNSRDIFILRSLIDNCLEHPYNEYYQKNLFNMFMKEREYYNNNLEDKYLE